MPDVRVNAIQSLDYRPRCKPLAEPLHPLWSVPVGYEAGHTRFLSVGPNLVLVDGQQGWWEVDSGLPAQWTYRAMPLGNIAGGRGGHVVVFDAEGHIYRYQWGAAPERVWSTGVPATDLMAMGLDAHRVLVQTAHAGRWQMQAIDLQAQRIHWSRPGMAPLVFPFEGGLLLEPVDAPDTVVCLDAETGQVRWKAPRLTGMVNLIGCIGQTLWIGASPATLYALSLADGARTATVSIPEHGVPQGVLDETGRLHLCNGVQYHILDLADQGRIVTGGALNWQGLGPTGALGRLAVRTADSRLFFIDDQGRVLCIDPVHGNRVEVHYKDRVPAASLGVAHQQLLMMDRQGTLHAWGA